MNNQQKPIIKNFEKRKREITETAETHEAEGVIDCPVCGEAADCAAIINTETGEELKFIYIECSECDFNQYG